MRLYLEVLMMARLVLVAGFCLVSSPILPVFAKEACTIMIAPTNLTVKAQVPPDPPESGCDVFGEWDPEAQEYPCISPIVVQIGPRKPYTFTSVENGVVFDIDGDGRYDRVAWTAADSDTAFLALDRNGNGYIDGGRELIGEYFYRDNKNQESAFDTLWRMQRKESGKVQRTGADDQDPFFAKLLVWTDRNHNGFSEPSELEPFAKYYSNIPVLARDSEQVR
jgi:hypothetical protein